MTNKGWNIALLVLFTAVFSAFPAFASWNLWPSGKYRYDDASRYNAGGVSIEESSTASTSHGCPETWT